MAARTKPGPARARRASNLPACSMGRKGAGRGEVLGRLRRCDADRERPTPEPWVAWIAAADPRKNWLFLPAWGLWPDVVVGP